MRYPVALATSRGIFCTKCPRYIHTLDCGKTQLNSNQKGFDCLNIPTNETIMQLNMPTSMNCT